MNKWTRLVFGLFLCLGISPWFVGILELYNHSRAGDFARPWFMTDMELARIRAMDLLVQDAEQRKAQEMRMDQIAEEMEKRSTIKLKQK